MKRWLQLLWLIVPVVAVLELGHHVWVQSRVPRDQDWQAAAQVIASGQQQGDLVVISPWWASQGWVYLGDFMTVEQMSRPDDGGYGRIWEVALPGHDQPSYEDTGKLLSEQDAGRLTVRLWNFPDGPTNLYDFVSGIENDAAVSMIAGQGGQPEPCSFKSNPTAGMVPNAAVQTGKWRCDPRLPWNYVAREVIADLDNKPRLCLWAHPVQGKRIHIEFDGIPEGSVIVGHTGRKYEADREQVGRPPVYLEISAAGQVIGTAAHEEHGGWTPFRFDLGPAGTAGKVTFEVHSPQAGMAHFCFSAKLRDK